MKMVACTSGDEVELALLNRMLIEDENADNTMTLPELERRMAGLLRDGYAAVFFEKDGRRVGYALVNMAATPLYLRQFFICREFRKMGYGRAAFYALLELLQVAEIDIDVYTWNKGGVAFWKSLGFAERYCNMRFKNL